ncbi:MAG: hypothetical protein NVS1B10_03070 [Candidatus Saccharimonadales bacterium]
MNLETVKLHTVESRLRLFDPPFVIEGNLRNVQTVIAGFVSPEDETLLLKPEHYVFTEPHCKESIPAGRDPVFQQAHTDYFQRVTGLYSGNEILNERFPQGAMLKEFRVKRAQRKAAMKIFEHMGIVSSQASNYVRNNF